MVLPHLAHKRFAASVLEPLPPKVHFQSLLCQVMFFKAGSGLSLAPSRKHYLEDMDLGMHRYSVSVAGTRNLLIPDPPPEFSSGKSNVLQSEAVLIRRGTRHSHDTDTGFPNRDNHSEEVQWVDSNHRAPILALAHHFPL